MPRLGRHPLKVKGLRDEINHQDITITTIVHIPTLSGYWEQSLEVLKLFFESLFASTNLPFDLMVFDNNSCIEVQNFLLSLKRESKIQYLILSQHNLRKLGALNHLLTMAPGKYVAFADSDVYFIPQWLEESLKILKTFPDAGQVTALPIITEAGERYVSTLAGIEKDSKIEVAYGTNLIPEEYVIAHSSSIGSSLEKYLERTPKRKDILIKYMFNGLMRIKGRIIC